MKVLSAIQQREADLYTIAHEPVSGIQLMERAATACARAMLKHLHKAPSPTLIHLVCGPGNNGGDGLVLARLLVQEGYALRVWLMPGKFTPEYLYNKERLGQVAGIQYTLVDSEQWPVVQADHLVVDCLFGSGLNRPPEGLSAKLINYLNATSAKRWSVDIPSGLMADAAPDQQASIFKAHRTFTFQAPKYTFLFDACFQYTGIWEVVPIGLHPDYLAQANCQCFLITRNMAADIYKIRLPIVHKGSLGHALLLAGSTGKGGAAIMAAEACLRSGCGLLSVKVPGSLANALLSRLPEAMTLPDPHPDRLTQAIPMQQFQAIGIGPGIGLADDTAACVADTLRASVRPVVLDADALNLLAEKPDMAALLPAESILTPHPKEFQRLLKALLPDAADANVVDLHKAQLRLSALLNVYIIRKGACSCISCPNGYSFFNTQGSPGMATAGSGDVLTGILTGLLAQGCTPLQTCVLGVFLHGTAGKTAARHLSEEAMLAGDIIHYLGKAYKMLRKLKN